MFKNERGITLVALVVTIIVLLILAGVAISLTISDDGIFGREQNANEKYDKAAKNENTMLQEVVNTYDNYVQNLNLD